ncbi:hypothetical protein TcBrA4_0082260 [Trypanosoma cruzi]|nr:hypothetical protein TcBrA4_0082260 [Trypanosoma cruzi]
MRPVRTLLSRWTVKPPKALSGKLHSSTQPQKIRWGGVSGEKALSSIFDVSIQPHVEGKRRSMNHCAPKGLPHGFAQTGQPPTLRE